MKRISALLLDVTIVMVLATVVIPAVSQFAHGAMADCHDATCRITAADGGRGTGCCFEQSQGYVYVLTNAHVATSSVVQCEFWRAGHQSRPIPGRVIARSTAADAAIVALSQSAFDGVLPMVVPIAARGDIARVLQPGHAWYVWGGYANCANYPPFFKKHGLYFSQAIIWDKQHPVLTRKDFMTTMDGVSLRPRHPNRATKPKPDTVESTPCKDGPGNHLAYRHLGSLPVFQK